MSFLHTSNISLYTVPAAWLLCIYPHVFAIKAYEKLTGQPLADKSPKDDASEDYRFDKTQPRTFMATIEANPHPALTAERKGMLARAEAASWNGYENLGFYAASVVAANLALVARTQELAFGASLGIEIWYLNAFAVGHLVSRVLFNIAYIRGVSGMHRGAYFYTGVACTIALFVRAGHALRKFGRI